MLIANQGACAGARAGPDPTLLGAAGGATQGPGLRGLHSCPSADKGQGVLVTAPPPQATLTFSRVASSDANISPKTQGILWQFICLFSSYSPLRGLGGWGSSICPESHMVGRRLSSSLQFLFLGFLFDHLPLIAPSVSTCAHPFLSLSLPPISLLRGDSHSGPLVVRRSGRAPGGSKSHLCAE